MTPDVAVLLLVVGAAGVLAGLLPGFRFAGALAALAALLALVAVLLMGFWLPAESTVARWPGGVVLLAAEPHTWLFALAFLVVLFGLQLSGAVRSGGRRVAVRCCSLLLSAAVLGVIFAADLLTLAVAWAAVDLAGFALCLAGKEADLHSSDAVTAGALRLGLNLAAVAALTVAALDVPQSAGLMLGSVALQGRTTAWLWIAAAVRLHLFPMQLVMHAGGGERRGRAALLLLTPLACTAVLLAALAAQPPSAALSAVLTAAAVASALSGGWKFNAEPDVQLAPSNLGLALSGVVMLVALHAGGAAASGVMLVGVTGMITCGTLFAYLGFVRSDAAWVAAPVLAAAIMAGLPLTVGFVALRTVAAGLLCNAAPLWLVLFLIALILMAAGMLRQALRPGVAPNWSEPFASTAYLFGLGAPLAFAVAVGSAPVALGRMLGEAESAARPAANLLAAGCTLLVSGAALVLWRLRPVVVERARRWLAVAEILRWQSVYAAVWQGYRSTGRSLRVAAAVLEGDGGVLWMLVGALLAGLLVEL
jgi:formate hydrogenlyase subunit 3/multisubunit Na+/H+ antiporter MnhD subunit